jgi:Tol biopolymer transport system component
VIGQTVSHYTIVEELGAGGMGVVFRAEDTRLQRVVALKFLSPDLTRDAESRGRFIQEAQAASALEHANICTIHEIDQSDDGQLYICMAFYHGETLQDRLARGQMGLDQVLDIAVQILNGLGKAHAEGIIHRDVKPANVMLTDDGSVKLLDFGLAKLSGQSGITRTGMALGTAAYMSPEQARGGTVDHRTDIWSFGVVLHQMVTGEPAFRGDAPPAVVYAILNEHPPPLSSLRSGVPLEIERIVDRCLEKNPADRYQTVVDLVADLGRIKRALESSKTYAIPARTSRVARIRTRPRWWLPLATAAAGLAAGVIAAVGLHAVLESNRPTDARAPAGNGQAFTRVTGAGGMADFASWSPDGSSIAYAADEMGSMDLYLRRADGGRPERLTADPGNEFDPAWSPDGRSLAYAADADGGSLFLIPSDGGSPHQLRDHVGLPIRGRQPSWSPDGKTLAFEWMGAVWLVPYSGGQPRNVITGTSSAPYATWGPDRHLLYWDRTHGDLHAIPVDGGAARPLGLVPAGEEVAGISWSSSDNHLYYCRGPFGGNKSLWSVALDPATLHPAGPPRPLTNPLTDVVRCALSPDGRRLAFTLSHIERHLWAVHREGGDGSLRQLTTRGGRNYYPALSGDGSQLVWTSHRTAKGVLYAMELPSGAERKVTRDWSRTTREVHASFSPTGEIAFSSTARGSYELWRVPAVDSVALQITDTQSPVKDSSAAWSPDGRTIALYSNRAGNWDVWLTEVNSAEPPRQLIDWESNEVYPVWSPDGRQLAITSDRNGSSDIWLVDVATGEAEVLVDAPSEEGWAAWSPDGRQVYFTSDRDGHFNVWVVPARGGPERQVTSFREMARGLPEAALFTRFAVTAEALVLPVERRSGEIFMIEARPQE